MGYSRGGADHTLFIKRSQREVIVVQIYVNDIVYGFVEQFVEHKSTEFEMSLVGKLIYFLGIQVRQTNSGTFVS